MFAEINFKAFTARANRLITSFVCEPCNRMYKKTRHLTRNRLQLFEVTTYGRPGRFAWK